MLKGKAKIIVLCGVAAVIIGTAVLTTSAVTNNLQKEKKNDFVPAVISLAVVENNDDNSEPEKKSKLEWKETVGEDKYTADKKVEIVNLNNENVNNTSAYIRVCINPRWTSEVTVDEGTENESTVSIDTDLPLTNFGALTGINIESNSYTMGDVTFHLANDWSDNWFYNSKDGYFYCKKVIAFGKKTPELLDSVTISSDTKEQLDSLGAKLTVDILADGIQSEGKAANTMWTNIKINADGELEKKE